MLVLSIVLAAARALALALAFAWGGRERGIGRRGSAGWKRYGILYLHRTSWSLSLEAVDVYEKLSSDCSHQVIYQNYFSRFRQRKQMLKLARTVYLDSDRVGTGGRNAV